jgi:RNA polymerase sigma-70 factor, ECF subfamily
MNPPQDTEHPPDEPTPGRPPDDLTPTLLTCLRAGDPEAGVQLDALYRRNLVRFCGGYLGNAAEVEDVVQDVFCRVLTSPTVPDNFRAWIYQVARNRCLDVLRARGRRRDDQDLPDDSRLQADLTGNLTRLVRRELRSRLHHLVAGLTAGQREVLRLRYVEGLSRAEIAQVLEVPETLVKSRLFEGLEKLRDHSSLVEGA